MRVQTILAAVGLALTALSAPAAAQQPKLIAIVNFGEHPVLRETIEGFKATIVKAGFVEGRPDDLPPARREKYDRSGRNSRVLVKQLR